MRGAAASNLVAGSNGPGRAPGCVSGGRDKSKVFAGILDVISVINCLVYKKTQNSRSKTFCGTKKGHRACPISYKYVNQNVI